MEAEKHEGRPKPASPQTAHPNVSNSVHDDVGLIPGFGCGREQMGLARVFWWEGKPGLRSDIWKEVDRASQQSQLLDDQLADLIERCKARGQGRKTRTNA